VFQIPVSGINIGPVHKKDVMRAGVMLERRPEFAVILAFDVKVAPEAAEIAETMGVKIFTADIIYHLFDMCTAYMNRLKEERRAASAESAIFPVVLEVLPNMAFNTKNPLVLGCKVVEGIARIGTPLCVPAREKVVIGKLIGIQKNHEDVKEAKRGDECAFKIENMQGNQTIVFGRHLDFNDQLVSRITRESIDVLKANFKEDLSDAEWRLIIKLKGLLEIM
jgi:translation initiation factor 5B